MTQDILVAHDGGIATVTFNRPKMRNAISLAMWAEIARVTEGLAKDDSVRAIVYRGAGHAAFASGADISEFEENRKDTATALAYGKQTDAAYTGIRVCPKPTVAMVFGFCMGGAMAIAMACDLRFTADTGKFAIPAARLGIVYGLHSVKRLVSLVGPAAAKDILFSARALDAAEALRIGFVNRVLPAAELAGHTYEYLGKVAENAPLSVQAAKLIVESIVEDGGVAKQAEIARRQIAAFESEDYREGTAAFMEKRRPRFVGR